MTFHRFTVRAVIVTRNILQIEEQAVCRRWHRTDRFIGTQIPRRPCLCILSETVDALGNIWLCFCTWCHQFSKTWNHSDGRGRVSEYISSQRFLHLSLSTSLAGEMPDGGWEAVTLEPVFDEKNGSNRFRVGIYPDYFEGVQFSRDRKP